MNSTTQYRSLLEDTSSPVLFNNNTFETSVHELTSRADWIIPITVSLILITLTLWIMLSLVVYGIKSNKWRRTQTNNVDKLNVGSIYTTVVFCALFCFLHQVVNLLYLNVGFDSSEDELCDLLGDTAVSIYFLLLFCVNMFYWFRQRIFFENKMLKVSYHKSVKILSSLSIVVIFAGGITVLIINNIPNNRKASSDGCTFRPEEDMRVTYWVPIVALGIAAQIVLLGLLAYAVKVTKAIKNTTYQSIKNKLRFRGSSKSQVVVATMPSNDSSGVSTNNTLSQKSTTVRRKRSSKKTIQKILKKTLLFGVLSTVLDVFIQILIHYIIPSDGNRRIVTTVSNVNAFLNLLFLIFSFVQYKDILTSPFKKYKKQVEVRSV